MPGPTLLVGYAREPPGFGRVTCAVADRLCRLRDVHVLAVDAAESRSANGWTLHPNRSATDPIGERALEELVAVLEPSTVVLYHDPWRVARWLRALDGCRAAVAAYCPLDGEVSRAGIITGLRALDGLAVPTRWARDEVRRVVSRSQDAGASVFEHVVIVPHGIDLSAFGPRGGELLDFGSRRRAARRRLFPGRPDTWDGFWVLNANRHDARKDLQATLRGFACFAPEAADARLYLRWGAAGDHGPDLGELARRLGIADRVLCGPGTMMSTRRLNLAYNASDVGVNTSIGEGWGLVSFEHAATGAPQIVPDHTACRELWRGAATLLPTSPRLSPSWMVTGGEVNPDALAAALAELYRDRGRYISAARAAVARARDPALHWDAVADAWHTWLCATERRAAAA